MKASDIPAKFPEVFAQSATSSYKRTIPQTSSDPNAASLDLGFPPGVFGTGGTPPDGRDFNGILNQSTGWNQWQNAGGQVGYDSAFSTAVGGYPLGSILAAASGVGNFWISTADDNTSDPDTGGANWTAFTVGAAPSVPVGTVTFFAASAPPSGYLECNGSVISTSTYAALFAVIGYTFGSVGIFRVPDLRGLFPRGWDHGSGVDPGRAFGSLQTDAFRAHSHTFPVKSSDTSAAFAADGSGTTSNTISTDSTGGTETRPINLALLPCIKY